MRSSSTRKARSTRYPPRKIGRNPDPLRSVARGARQIAHSHQRGPQPPVATDCAVGKRRQSQHNTARHHPGSELRSTLRNFPRSPELSCCDRKSAVLRSPRPIDPVSYLWALFSMSSRPTPPRTSTARRTTSAPGRRARAAAWSFAGANSAAFPHANSKTGSRSSLSARRAAPAGHVRAASARVCTPAHFGDTVRPPRRTAALAVRVAGPSTSHRESALASPSQLLHARVSGPNGDHRRTQTSPRHACAAPCTHQLGTDSNTPQSTR